MPDEGSYPYSGGDRIVCVAPITYNGDGSTPTYVRDSPDLYKPGIHGTVGNNGFMDHDRDLMVVWDIDAVEEIERFACIDCVAPVDPLPDTLTPETIDRWLSDV